MIDPKFLVGRPICSSCGFALECAAHLVPAADGAALISVCRGCFLLAHVRLTILANGPGTSTRSCAETGLEALYDSLVGEQRQSVQGAQEWFERSFPAQDVRAAQTSRASAASSSKGTGCRTRSRSRSRASSRPRKRSPLRRRPGKSEAVASGHCAGSGGSGSWMPGAAP